MPMPVNSYQFTKDERWVLLHIPRAVLVFSRCEWITAIRRGKVWRRHGGERLTSGSKLRKDDEAS
jgi:hypothetical protein